MDLLWNSFFADPLYYVGCVVAFAAAIAFLTFLRGFLSGMPGLFTLSSHEGHQTRHKYHAVRGVTGLFGLLLLWETLRLVANWLGAGIVPLNAFLTLVVGFIVVGLMLWGWRTLREAVLNKGH